MSALNGFILANVATIALLLVCIIFDVRAPAARPMLAIYLSIVGVIQAAIFAGAL